MFPEIKYSGFVKPLRKINERIENKGGPTKKQGEEIDRIFDEITKLNEDTKNALKLLNKDLRKKDRDFIISLFRYHTFKKGLKPKQQKWFDDLIRKNL